MAKGEFTFESNLRKYARHKHVVARWNYWVNVKRRRIDDVYLILEYQECFLAAKTVDAILREFKEDALMEKALQDKITFKHPKSKGKKVQHPSLFEN